MKTLKAATILAMAVLVLGYASKATAETYLGEYCWNFSSSYDGTGSIKAGVYEKEGGHYVLFGTRTSSSGTYAISGSAEIVGSSVVLSGSNSGYDSGYPYGMTHYGSLSLSTLSGTYHATGVINYGGTLYAFYDAGTMILTSCP